MSDLAAVTATVRVVQSIEQITLPAGAVITAGQLVGIDSDGKWALARATTGPVVTRGIAIQAATVAGMPVTAIKKGLVDIGNILGGLAHSAQLYASDTAGVISDASVSSLAPIGYVEPAWGATTADKLFRVDL